LRRNHEPTSYRYPQYPQSAEIALLGRRHPPRWQPVHCALQCHQPCLVAAVRRGRVAAGMVRGCNMMTTYSHGRVIDLLTTLAHGWPADLILLSHAGRLYLVRTGTGRVLWDTSLIAADGGRDVVASADKKGNQFLEW
jgi:hypothetical protein